MHHVDFACKGCATCGLRYDIGSKSKSRNPEPKSQAEAPKRRPTDSQRRRAAPTTTRVANAAKDVQVAEDLGNFVIHVCP